MVDGSTYSSIHSYLLLLAQGETLLKRAGETNRQQPVSGRMIQSWHHEQESSSQLIYISIVIVNHSMMLSLWNSNYLDFWVTIMTSSIRQKIFRSGMHRCTISEPNQWASIIQLSSQLTQISLENSLGWCIEIEIDCYVAGATCVGGCAQFTWWNSFQHWNSTSVNSRLCVLHSTVNLLLTEPLRSTGAFYIKFKRWLSAAGLRNVRAFYESASQSRTNQPQREYLNQS